MARTALVLALLAVAYTLLQRYLTPLPPPAQGSCKPKFKALEKIYRENFKTGVEQGSAFAVYHKGELVCDLWGGWADQTNDLPWSEETMTFVFSSTKGACAVSVAVLCDRGFCDYDDLVTKYWPEFGRNGKDNITLAILMSHQGGLAAIDEHISLEMINEDPEKIGQIIADQKPNWPPGTGHGYHALSYGVVVDQLVRRIDPKHRSLDQFFREEIAEPYDIDLHIGLPYSLQWRAARYNKQSVLSSLSDASSDWDTMKLYYDLMTSENPLFEKAVTNPPMVEEHLNWPIYRATPQGGYSGFGTARGLAKLYSIVVSGKHHNGSPLLSPKTVGRLHTILSDNVDYVFRIPMVFGYGVNIIDMGSKGNKAIFNPGHGCQMGMGSSGLDTAWAYINNYPSTYISPLNDPRIKPLYEALLEALNA